MKITGLCILCIGGLGDILSGVLAALMGFYQVADMEKSALGEKCRHVEMTINELLLVSAE